MDHANIERDVRAFLTETFFSGRPEELSGEGSLLGGVIDSTGILQLVSHLQDHFAIVVEDEDIVPENLDSVKNVVGYVSRKLESKG